MQCVVFRARRDGAYRVEVSWANSGVHVADFYGVRIAYTITSPLP